MTTHSAPMHEFHAPSRTPLLAGIGLVSSAVLTAIGTFWDINNNDNGANDSFGDWLPVVVVAAVAAALVYGLVVRRAEEGNPSRRSAVLGVVGFLSVGVFWSGLPMVLASAAVACAYADKDKSQAFSTASHVGLGLALLTTVGAITLAIAG